MSGFLDWGPKDVRHDFNYNVDETQYQADPRMRMSYSFLNRQGGRLNTMADKFMRSADEFLDPDSSWMTGQRQNLRSDITDSTANQNLLLNQMLAARGLGGSPSSLLKAASQNRANEQVRKGYLNLTNQGIGHAQNFGQMAIGAGSQATQAYGQAGDLSSQWDARATQVALANSAAVNQRNQYANQGLLELKAGNAARQDAYRNAWMGAGTTLAGLAFGPGGLWGSPLGNTTNWNVGHGVTGSTN